MNLSGNQSERERKFIFLELMKEDPICKMYYITPEMVMKSNQFQSCLQNLFSRNKLSRHFFFVFILLDLLLMRLIV